MAPMSSIPRTARPALFAVFAVAGLLTGSPPLLGQPSQAPAAPAKPVPACSCPETGGTLAHAQEVAQEIFTGEVVGERLVGVELKRSTILVAASWRSDLSVAEAETASGPCGAKLELGKSYLFYATWKENRAALLIGACLRYLPVEAAKDDLARLGKATSEHAITLERRQALADGNEASRKTNPCKRHLQDAPPYFLPTHRPIRFEVQRILDDTGTEVGTFHGTWTPRQTGDGTFVEIQVDNKGACPLHLKLDARLAGQPVHLSRSEEYVPAATKFWVRFVVTPPAGASGDVELKAYWELVAGGG